MKLEKITAITVTFNRTVTLKKCIAALLTQNRHVDDIIIVDNHSKPEERAILDDIAASDERIHLHVLSDNMGGAGGFEAGMRLAVEKYPADWYWIMDDDAYPRADCLEKLLEARDELTAMKSEIGFLAPLIYGVDLKKYQLFHHKKLTKIIYRSKPIVTDVNLLDLITAIEADAFVGPLISAKAVERHGIADGSLFIYGDDTEYTYRVTRDMKAFLIKNAVIEHQDAPVLDANMSAKGWWKEYYGNRNQFFFIREFRKNIIYRCISYICLCLRLYAIIIKSGVKRYHILRTRLILKSISDGIMNRRGKTIDPVKYMKYLKDHGID